MASSGEAPAAPGGASGRGGGVAASPDAQTGQRRWQQTQSREFWWYFTEEISSEISFMCEEMMTMKPKENPSAR